MRLDRKEKYCLCYI